MRASIIAGTCAAAICAFGSITAVGALAAQPEYVGCVKAAKSGKTYTGKFSDKACSEPNAKSEGKYELGPAKLPGKLKGTTGKMDIYLYAPLTEKIEGHFECTGGKESGTLTSSTAGTMSVSYSGCKATGGLAGPCNSPGQKSGTVTSEPLATKLAWLNEAETEAGLEIKPATPGGALTKVVCAGGAETAEMVGTMLASFVPAAGASKFETIDLTASPTTGEPAFDGVWEEGGFVSEPLASNLKGLKEFEGVPTGQNDTLTQKGPTILID
ncbi:MAG TPA: hypothetical protein VH061_10525 [Solirubrobacteraceae bacterium]|jgi:hypothetical protein|nr:hypothetical protein [Solirubrobacteraceae bacterium]